MIRIHTAGIAFVVLILTAGRSNSQTWNLVREKEGISVYTTTSGNGSLKTFKGIADVHSSAEKVYALLGTAKNNDDWDKSIKEFRVLSEKKDKSFSYYLIYSIPWPLQNRDLCVEVNITHDSVNGAITIYARSNPRLVPESSSMVRIRNYWQKWVIQPLGKNDVRLTLEGYADPSGSIPSWLYNMVITDTPIKLISEVRQRVQ